MIGGKKITGAKRLNRSESSRKESITRGAQPADRDSLLFHQILTHAPRGRGAGSAGVSVPEGPLWHHDCEGRSRKARSGGHAGEDVQAGQDRNRK